MHLGFPASSVGISEHLNQLVPYQPGKPIAETKRELGLKKVIKLASNENPLGPSPKALLAIRTQLKGLNRYPDSGAFELKEQLVKLKKVDRSQILIGAGSDEIITLATRAFSAAGDSMITSQAAFIAYKLAGKTHGLQVIETPMTSDFRFDLPAMLHQIQSNPAIKVCFIANPNNPTGTWVSTIELEMFFEGLKKINRPVLVVLDAAYIEYQYGANAMDPLALLKRYPNLLVLHTFSKIYGLAGLRVGYGMSDAKIISGLERVRLPFNTNSLALTAACAALGDRSFLARSQKINQDGMRLMTHGFDQNKIQYLPSRGNFLLVNTDTSFGLSGDDVFQKILKKGIILRPVTNYGLKNWIRISIGLLAENKKILQILKELKAEHTTS